jgi:hypothetical protein
VGKIVWRFPWRDGPQTTGLPAYPSRVPDASGLRDSSVHKNLCRALSRRRGRLVRKAKSCWRRARFSRMRSSRERKALITQPMRCRSHEIMAKIVSNHPSTSRWQLVHSPSAPGFDEGQGEKMLPSEPGLKELYITPRTLVLAVWGPHLRAAAHSPLNDWTNTSAFRENNQANAGAC